MVDLKELSKVVRMAFYMAVLMVVLKGLSMVDLRDNEKAKKMVDLSD